MPALVLDSEALGVLADPRAGKQLDAVRARLAIAAKRGWPVRVPSVVLAELYRSTSRMQATDAAVARFGVRPLTTGRSIARVAGLLLGRDALDTCHLVDAAVIATAVRSGGGVVLTADVGDLRALAVDHPNVEIASV